MSHSINGETQLLGLLGWPVSHSFSPAMHNAALAAAGLNVVYLPLPVRPEKLKTAVSALSSLNFRGVNVTVPHKQTIIPFLDEIDPAAAAIGAVNTVIVTEDGHLLGKNSDWLGFMADLAALNVDVNGRSCVIFGAGGSARAVAYGLAQAGAMVHIVARRPAQAQKLVQELMEITDLQSTFITTATMDDVSAMSAPLLVNSTPLGMHPHKDGSVWDNMGQGLDKRPFSPNTFVYDLVYNPTETVLMRQAQAAGCRAANGLGMLLRQGAASFEWWTGVTPDLNVMQTAMQKS